MRKFLLLRILSITTSVLLTLCLVFYNIGFFDNPDNERLVSFLLTNLFLLILLNHSVLASISRSRYYPDKYISRGFLVYHGISAVICWISVATVVFFMVAGFFGSEKGREDYIMLAVGGALVIVYVFQLILLNKFLKVIINNYNQQLEEFLEP